MSWIKGAAAWLGIVPDERYAYDRDDTDDELTDVVEEAELEEYEPSTVTPINRKQEKAVELRPSAPSTPKFADSSRIITVHPRTYNEARTIGEHYRDGVPVIMNLSEMDDADAKRLVDFAAGLIFGLRGDIERVTSKVFLLSPNNVNVTAEDKQRIASGGFFNQS